MVSKYAKAIAIGSAGAVILGGTALAIHRKRSKSNKKNAKRKSKSRNKYKNTRSHSKHQKKPYTAGKRKDTSTRRIRYTKNNQPYVILKNGRAKFISKKSVKTSRKRAGGRY